MQIIQGDSGPQRRGNKIIIDHQHTVQRGLTPQPAGITATRPIKKDDKNISSATHKKKNNPEKLVKVLRTGFFFCLLPPYGTRRIWATNKA